MYYDKKIGQYGIESGPDNIKLLTPEQMIEITNYCLVGVREVAFDVESLDEWGTEYERWIPGLMGLYCNGEMITDFLYSSIRVPSYSTDLIYAWRDYSMGFLNENGEEISPFVFENGDSIYKGAIAVMKDGKWGFVDRKGEVLIPFLFESALTIDEDSAFVKYEGKYGILNKKAAIEYFKDNTEMPK